jgi:ketosteroid isomerase-like protein
MSQENVAVVQASFDAWNAGDMDAYRELLDSEVTSRPPPGWPEPGPFAGREATLDQFLRIRDAWDFDTAEPISDFIHAADRVLVRFGYHGEGRGPEANTEISCIYTVRHGKILGFEFFWDHAEALEAAGLSE